MFNPCAMDESTCIYLLARVTKHVRLYVPRKALTRQVKGDVECKHNKETIKKDVCTLETASQISDEQRTTSSRGPSLKPLKVCMK